MRIIKTNSWEILANEHNIPIFHITEFHKIPNGIKCILITGDNSFTHKGNIIQCASHGGRHNPYISDVKIPDSIIFSTNAAIWHPNIIPIPIGVLDFDEKLLKRDTFGVEKSIVCYANFTDWCERSEIIKIAKEEPYILWKRYDGEDSHEKYRADLCNSNFVISPPGNGIDCYRTWESIYSGAIPIVIRNPMYEQWNSLPIIMLDSWKDLQIDIIQQKYDDLKARGGNYDMADLDYWEQRIIKL